MIRLRILAAALLVACCATGALAADTAGYDRLVEDMDAARVAGADIFAPKTWEKALKAFVQAKRAVIERKKQATLDKHVAEAAEYTANAVKAAEVGQLSLQEYLGPRDKAQKAGAPALVPELYAEAEEVFLKATRKVEDGKVKDALKEAAKAAPLYDVAEMEAIRVTILGTADKLIAKAVADGAEKYAPSTLDKARSARSKANTILTSDRYNRGEAVTLAERAEYEARHASSIGTSVRSLERNDQAWEKLMLGYEIHMNRVGESFQLERLSFDDGPQAATQQLIAQIEELQQQNARLNAQLAGMTTSLTHSLAEIGEDSPASDPKQLAEQLERRIAELKVKQRSLATQLQSGQEDMAALAARQRETELELTERREREEKFRQAKTLLTPSEGEVLFNAANDVVLRLHGLSFRPGNHSLEDHHMGLLAKVQQVIQMYPETHLTIEGHTDITGDAAANVTLSEKRAYSVMQYLRESLLIPRDRITSMGYGADRPVASNKTADGRAKNRRIDIIIMQ